MSPSTPSFALMTVNCQEGAPSLEQAAQQLGVSVHDVDASYGIVPIDPDRGLYAVQVRGDKLPAKSENTRGEAHRGPWSNPKIEPFGPPKE
jgi:hypothetical protein